MATMTRGIIGLAIAASVLAGIGIGAVGVVAAPPRHIIVNRVKLQDSPELHSLIQARIAATVAEAQARARLDARPNRPRFVVM